MIVLEITISAELHFKKEQDCEKEILLCIERPRDQAEYLDLV